MILLIDNYDSFSYNLVQLTGSLTGEEIRVIRNDEMTPEELEGQRMSHLILSPGPGRPADAGICEEAVKRLAGKVPILGVCLGNQAICETFGAVITYAGRVMHGKQSILKLDTEVPVFRGLRKEEPAARYHSLAVKRDTLPECLQVAAETADGEVMAVCHREYPVYGFQFHPESVLTPSGRIMMEKFLKI